MPAIEAHSLSELCINVFQKMQNERDFDLFWQLVQSTKEELQLYEPVVHRKQKWRYEDGVGKPYTFESPCCTIALCTITVLMQLL